MAAKKSSSPKPSKKTASKGAKLKAATKRGRPARAEAPSSLGVTVRFTEAEHAAIVRAARDSGKTIASWLRDLAITASQSR